jgi:hypothetical protein
MIVIPCQREATLSGSRPISADFVKALESGDEMVSVATLEVFYAEVVDDKGENDCSLIVFPEAVCEVHWRVSMWSKKFDKLVVGDFAGLWEAVHASLDLDVDKAVADFGSQIVQVHDGIWDHVDGYSHVLISVHGRSQVEVLEVASHEFCAWCRDDAVEEELGIDETSGFGADVTRIFDAVAADGPTYSEWVLLFWPVSADDSEIRDFATLLGDLFGVDKENGVGSFDVAMTLGKTANFVGVRLLPQVALAALAEF